MLGRDVRFGIEIIFLFLFVFVVFRLRGDRLVCFFCVRFRDGGFVRDVFCGFVRGRWVCLVLGECDGGAREYTY